MTGNHNQSKRTPFFRIKSFRVFTFCFFFIPCARRRIMCCDEMWFWLLYFHIAVFCSGFIQTFLNNKLSVFSFEAQTKKWWAFDVAWIHSFLTFNQNDFFWSSNQHLGCSNLDVRWWTYLFLVSFFCFCFQFQFERFVTHSIQMNIFIRWYRIKWDFPWKTCCIDEKNNWIQFYSVFD